MQGGKCFFCGDIMSPVPFPRSKVGFTRDHLIPKKENGSDKEPLIVLAHDW
jgi:hypothetical protein